MDLHPSLDDLLREPASSSRPREPAHILRASAKLGKRQSSGYRYYAGYSPEFVRSVITATLEDGATILDPWNGAGTTTAVAAELGYRSVGVDLNPAMLVVAAARLASVSDWSTVSTMVPKAWHCSEERTDVLRRWFTPKAANALRGFERALLNSCGAREDFWAFDAPDACTGTQAVAAFLAAVVAGRLLSEFRTSNPTWIRLRVPPDERIDPKRSDIRRVAQQFLAEGMPFGASRSKQFPRLVLANSESLPLGEGVYDLVVTSPPYCTRLDYVVATLPELAAIGAPTWSDVERMRNTMLGGPSRNELIHPSALESLGETARSFLSAVRDHSSKAAGAYYYRFYSRYLARYTETIRKLAACTRRGGLVVLVVQDSHFKELAVRLAAWTKEALIHAGMKVEDEWSYSVPNPKALNPAGKRYRLSNATVESVVMARKEALP